MISCPSCKQAILFYGWVGVFRPHAEVIDYPLFCRCPEYPFDLLVELRQTAKTSNTEYGRNYPTGLMLEWREV